MVDIKPKRESFKQKNMKPTIDILNMYCDVCRKTYKAKNIFIAHLFRLHGMTLPDVYTESNNFDLL